MGGELNVKVGDYVLYEWGYFHSHVEKIVKVVKVTPTGRIRIDGYNEQYDKYGHQMGSKDKWYYGSSIRIPTEEDYKRIKENSVIQKALSLMKEATPTYEQALRVVDIFGKLEDFE